LSENSQKITGSGQSNSARTFTSRIGEIPPKYGIVWDSATTHATIGNQTTELKITDYTWTANWKETQE
jgi:hypothetical protein